MIYVYEESDVEGHVFELRENVRYALTGGKSIISYSSPTPWPRSLEAREPATFKE